jgi:hypothetical protein
VCQTLSSICARDVVGERGVDVDVDAEVDVGVDLEIDVVGRLYQCKLALDFDCGRFAPVTWLRKRESTWTSTRKLT